jgi:hypothetical protein
MARKNELRTEFRALINQSKTSNIPTTTGIKMASTLLREIKSNRDDSIIIKSLEKREKVLLKKKKNRSSGW